MCVRFEYKSFLRQRHMFGFLYFVQKKIPNNYSKKNYTLIDRLKNKRTELFGEKRGKTNEKDTRIKHLYN